MKENRELDFIEIEVCGFQDICNHIAELEKQNKELQSRNEFLERMCEGVKLNNSKLTLERNALLDELTTIKNMSMFEFANRHCNDSELEEAGHQLAKALGVGH